MSLTVSINLDDVAAQVRRAASESISEADLEVRVEGLLKGLVLEPLGIPWGRYEYSPKKYSTLISGVRIDALHAHVVVEYERPGSFEQRRSYEHAIQQVKDGIVRHAQGVTDRLPRYFGVALDGSKIGFVRYRQRLKDFEISKDPLGVNRSTVARLVEAIVGLKRKALDAEELLKDFGPDSEISRKVIRVFYDKLNGRISDRTSILFSDWRRVFSQVCAYDPEKLKGLEERYGFERGRADVEKLLFSLHSYFALLMKLLAAEVGSLYWPIMGSYLKALEDAYYRGYDRLKDQLRDLEEGGLFAKLGISNFLEGDYFAWYLDEWDPRVADEVASVVRKLSDYDPSTAELEPDKIKDLFKRLYQNLVPKKVRHDLGEYYTPDWLAELVLNEVGCTVENFGKLREEKNDPLAPLELRVLDPACGSGTFLVLVIKRLREYIDEHWVDKGSALQRIAKNVVGFDLNPLAVMASRANYLISIGDMLREKGAEQIEIPIYLADSIMVEQRTTVLGIRAYLLRTAAGNFEVPIGVVERGILSKVLGVMEECVKTYTTNEFMGRLEREVEIKEDEVETIKGLYETISKLEKEGKNRIWLRVLKNSFAPFLVERFDFVIGNPPWVNWENLPQTYRESTIPIWSHYGLFTLSGKEARLGGGKKDISMLFLYTSVQRYLKSNAFLAFVITQSLFKTMGAGEGFRRFRAGDNHFKVLKVHDMVDLTPFEGAQNRTSVVLVKTGLPTTYPVNYVVWRKQIRRKISQTSEFTEVLRVTDVIGNVAFPIDRNDPRSPWATLPEGTHDIMQKLAGRSGYKAWEGANTGGANGIYWVEILQKLPNGNLLIRNLSNVGKKKVKGVTTQVESDLVYPLLRGRDVSRWCAKPSCFIILTQNTKERVGIAERVMKLSYPATYNFLSEFKDFLAMRPLYRKYFGERRAAFYTIYNVGEYTLTPYKVVWRYIASGLLATVIGPTYIESLGDKVVVPDCKLMLVSCQTEEEAYYVCAVLNSRPIRLLAKSYLVETQISTHILENIRVITFDSSNVIHQKISELSKHAHLLATEHRQIELLQTEEQIDQLISQIYSLSDQQLNAIKKAIKLLEREEIEEEIEEFPALGADVTIRNNVAEADKPFGLEIVIQNPSDQSISNVKVKAELLGKTVEHLFVEVKGEKIIPMRLDGLKKGQYKMRLTMDYSLGGANKRLEKELSIIVKESEVKKAIDRGSVEELFEV